MKAYSAATDAAAVDKLTLRSAVIPADVDAKARAICDDVRRRGDDAVREYTERFEKRALVSLELDEATWTTEAAKVAPEIIRALEHAARNIATFHERQREPG